MRLIALVMLVVVAGLTDAHACPPGPCNKYRNRFNQPTSTLVTRYRRATRALPPASFDRRQLAWFLEATAWIPDTTVPVVRGPGSNTLRLIQAANVRRPPSTDRFVLIRELERRGGATYVAVDGIYYRLDRCDNTSCLTHVGALPEAEQQRFVLP
jgi:hypothetical protein